MSNDQEGILATRQMLLRTTDGREKEIRVEIRRLVEVSPDESWCYFTIRGAGSGREFQIVGSDSVQALQFALVAIGAELKYLENRYGAQIIWLGEAESGFPVTTYAVMGRQSPE